MAWNKYYIFISDQKNVSPSEVVKKIGLKDYVEDHEVSLAETNKPETLFIGNYNDCILIVDPSLPFQFFQPEPSETELRLISEFPDSEIAALIENSTVGLFGYAIIKKGKRIRVKDGSDGEIYNDIGELLPEEKEILSGEIFSRDELNEMREEMDEEEVQNMIKFEASWRAPNLISKRYLGVPVGSIDEQDVRLTKFIKK